jgi:hypothetical protein
MKRSGRRRNMVSKISKHHKAADLHEVQLKWCEIQEREEPF